MRNRYTSSNGRKEGKLWINRDIAELDARENVDHYCKQYIFTDWHFIIDQVSN